MSQDARGGSQPTLGYPMVWGFLSTILLGAAGYFGLRVGAWELLWLPLITPLFAFAYMRLRFHNSKGFERFLAGYGLCLFLIVVIGTLYLATIT